MKVVVEIYSSIPLTYLSVPWTPPLSEEMLELEMARDTHLIRKPGDGVIL